MARPWLLAAAILAWASTAGARQAHDDQTEQIFLGMSTALSGPAAQLGQDMALGVRAAFEEANRAAPTRAPLRLIALDDGYEPSRTIPNMHDLIDRRGVVAIIGNVGTPTAVVAAPIARAGKTLLFGAYSGAGVLRPTPPDRYIINFRASYGEETAAMVDALLAHTGLGVEDIGFFTQRDSYGDSGYAGGVAAMQRHGLAENAPVAHGRYERNTLAVENGLADILGTSHPPRAVIMVGAYEPCAEFVRVADEFGYRPLFLSVSFVGSQALAGALGPLGDGIVITQVVPHYRQDLPVCESYARALAACDPDASPGFTSFEGYIVGAVMADAVRRIRGPVTRDTVIDSLESLGVFDIGLSAPLSLSPSDHQASHGVWPTIIRSGEVVPLEWQDLGSLIPEPAR